MKLKHVQAELRDDEYKELAQAADAAGMTLKEALRQAVVNWARRQQGRPDPLDDVIGIAVDAPEDASETVDDIYLED